MSLIDRSPPRGVDEYSLFADDYDELYATKVEDINFYCELAAHSNGRILDIGCGTGRVSIPLAAQGRTVVGIDISPAMIRRAQSKLQVEPVEVRRRLTFVNEDICTLPSPEHKFEAAFFTFASFAHLHTRDQQIAALLRVREALNEGGKVVVGLTNWDVRTEARVRVDPVTLTCRGNMQPQWIWNRKNSVSHSTMVVTVSRGYDPSTQLLFSHQVFQHFDSELRLLSTSYHPLVFRISSRFEIEGLLAATGFQVLETWGDFDRSPLRPTSPELILLAERSDSRA